MEIRLTTGGVAIIDAGDFEQWFTVGFEDGATFTGRVCDLTWWRFDKPHTSYAIVKKWVFGKQKEIRLHRLIMQAGGSELVDHIDHNGLNCQRHNLRLTDDTGNARNRRPNRVRKYGARFKGVALHRQTGQFEAYIRVNGRKRHLGLFAHEEDGAAAYNAAAREAFGEFALLNNLEPQGAAQ